jgi:hypothetical protein
VAACAGILQEENLARQSLDDDVHAKLRFDG